MEMPLGLIRFASANAKTLFKFFIKVLFRLPRIVCH